MLVDKNIELWHGGKIKLLVEDRFIDSGEIFLNFDNGMDSYTESLILDNLLELRDKINEIIEQCKEIKS